MEKLSEIGDLIVDDLLVVEVVIGLEVNAGICYKENTFYLN